MNKHGTAPLPDWIAGKELYAAISDVTFRPRAEVKEIIEAYQLMLYEAILAGYKVKIPNIGIFMNEAVKGDEVPYNRPLFYYLPAFADKMFLRTCGNVYKDLTNNIKKTQPTRSGLSKAEEKRRARVAKKKEKIQAEEDDEFHRIRCRLQLLIHAKYELKLSILYLLQHNVLETNRHFDHLEERNELIFNESYNI